MNGLADLLPGVWRGTHAAGAAGRHHYIQVRGDGAGFAGQGLVWSGLTEAQVQAVVRRQRLRVEYPRALCARQQFAVTLEDQTVTFRAVAAQALLGGAGYFPSIFSGTLVAPGCVAGDAADAARTEGIFRFWKEGALDQPLPLELARGETHLLGCVDGGAYHYACYIPASYDPSRPTPVLVNLSPAGDGQPLCPAVAEETGWLMAGLTEAQNGPWGLVTANREAALFDLRRRFNIDMQRVFFSGFSGGARAASLSGQTYPGVCAGLILIGAAYAQDGPPPLDQPIFYLAGWSDFNREEVRRAYDQAKASGRRCELVIHPGDHDWGRPEDHEAAIRWLAREAPGARV